MNTNNANNNQHQQGAAFSFPTQFGFPAGMQFQGMPNQQVPGGGWFGMNMGMPPTPAGGGPQFGAAFAGQPEEAQQNQNNNSEEDTSAGDGGAAASNNGGNRQNVPAQQIGIEHTLWFYLQIARNSTKCYITQGLLTLKLSKIRNIILIVISICD